MVANTQRPVISGSPNDVDGAVKTSAIPPMNCFQMTFNEKMIVLTCATLAVWRDWFRRTGTKRQAKSTFCPEVHDHRVLARLKYPTSWYPAAECFSEV